MSLPDLKDSLAANPMAGKKQEKQGRGFSVKNEVNTKNNVDATRLDSEIHPKPKLHPARSLLVSRPPRLRVPLLGGDPVAKQSETRESQRRKDQNEAKGAKSSKLTKI